MWVQIDVLIWDVSNFFVFFSGFGGPGPEKSSPPCDSLYFGVGELYFDDF